MITRAIVEEQVDSYHYRVRIPLFDKIEESPIHTQFEDLCIATLSSVKGINHSLRVGDIVFIGFEDNNSSSPVILGQLYREALTKENNAFLNLSNLTITDSAQLPINTKIGDIEYNKLYNLFHIVEELQEKIERIE